MKLATLVSELGEPALITERNVSTKPEHWTMWLCGCMAGNTRGLCMPSGWRLQPCPEHAPMRETRPTTLA